ncbi:MAG: hypothetical protein K2X35_02990 [Bryobacteraceae bacterium]|nr:hypothetical protein [Bryobacteraceae bacterium]
MARAWLCLIVAAAGLAQTPIRYTVRIPDPENHYIEVEARVPTEGRPAVELKMAIWTQYVIREFAKNVEDVSAWTPAGAAARVEKIRKNRWRVAANGAKEVVVRYRVYAHRLHVQDNFVDDEFALLNGAPTFLTLADHRRPHEVRVEIPKPWTRAISAMDSCGENCFRARDYDDLVDSPIVLGTPAVYEFRVDGTPHALVNVSELGRFDGARAARDLEKIAAAQQRIWGSFPYDRYFFLNLLTGGGGGMEHARSTVMMADRGASGNAGRYRRWLTLSSHELFHAWNVKKLRPRAIVPGEFEQEPYTRELGIAEGFSTYYGALAVHRAGLMDAGEYLGELSRTVNELESAPGRLAQTLAESSFDTWIKFYGPDENTRNTSISYYTKGAVVGWLLDAKIRESSGGAKCLDHAMRLALARFPAERGYTLEDFRAVASEVAGADLSGFFRDAFETTRPLPCEAALKWLGLRWEEQPGDAAWTGMRVENGVVREVTRGSPAGRAGISTGDRLPGGETGDVEIERRGRKLQRRIEPAPGPPIRRLRVDENATEAQKRNREAWLAGR